VRPDVTGFDTTRLPTDDDPTALPGSGSPRDRTGPLVVGEHFGPRYLIVRLLGMGGMGAVYQAWDGELDVVVALKVILPETAGDPFATQAIERRFKQELLLARKVTHRNVVRIYDLGEIRGIKYITMSYLDGEDLATVLKRNGKLAVPEALKIMRHVAAGLLAAHDAGVVHRDLKPANIMIEGDNAVIMDFGIARASSVSPPVVPPPVAGPDVGRTSRYTLEATMAGSVVGTVAYMAPEQARGESVDHRADIYTWGLIVSDLLLGPRSLRGSVAEELQRRMTEAPPPLRSKDPQIPEALERIVSRSVMPDPAARYQTTAELVADLDRLDKNGKMLPLVRRLTPRLIAATGALVIAMLGGTYVLTRRAVEPPTQHEPVSMVIADFQNGTNDPTFDGTLEPMLRRALEGAGFISAYDRNGISRTLGVTLPDRLDETAAREIAVKQGLGVVLSGSIARQGNGYVVSVKTSQSVTGEEIASVSDRASNKGEVLEVATRLMTSVRQALGDEASESAQMFAMASLSTTSLDVVGHYAAGREAGSHNRYEEARRSYSRAVELDPKFGIGYQALAGVSLNLGNQQDAEKYIREALRYLEGMTERERYTTRAGFYLMTGDYPQCVKEYGDLLALYAADVAAHNNLAICSIYLRDIRKALDEMQRVVAILPQRALYRVNLALYSNYAGEFQAAEQEARTIQEPNVKALLALAFSQLGQGQLPQAMATYQKLETIDALGASFAASGLGDLAILEGRFSDATRILARGAAQDLTSKNVDRAASKFAALAHAEIGRGRARAAIAAAEQALANSDAVKIRFLTARSFVEAGDAGRARSLIDSLASELQAEPQAYAKIVEGELALKNGDARQAIKVLTEANALLDTWLGHFDLGRAYLEAGAFIQADSEFDRCLTRRGEALSLLLDEEPTYAHLAPVYYYQGRVREGLKTAGFAESYRAYLTLRGQSKEDPLVSEVRRRAAGG
jgi:serine/threonine protein kinase/tetratricopeptide (TPR) repeat protein